MRRFVAIGFMLAVFLGASTFAQARPPTVMNSPGYDARLKESREALGAPSPAPVTPPAPAPKHKKKKQTN